MVWPENLDNAYEKAANGQPFYTATDTPGQAVDLFGAWAALVNPYDSGRIAALYSVRNETTTEATGTQQVRANSNPVVDYDAYSIAEYRQILQENNMTPTQGNAPVPETTGPPSKMQLEMGVNQPITSGGGAPFSFGIFKEPHYDPGPPGTKVVDAPIVTPIFFPPGFVCVVHNLYYIGNTTPVILNNLTEVVYRFREFDIDLLYA